MSKRRYGLILASVLPLLAFVAPSRAADRFWAGGGVGVGFGDVTYVSIEPVAGYDATARLGVGARLTYRYRDDERYSPSLTTTDYGASLFGRYEVTQPVFLQVEYEYLSYEYPLTGGSIVRDDYDSVLAGAGVTQPIGGNGSLFVTALYNFSYHDDEPSPYDDPWVIRVGVGFAF